MSFTPVSPWADGAYQLQVDFALADVNGNAPIAPFDADGLGSAVEAVAGHRILA